MKGIFLEESLPVSEEEGLLCTLRSLANDEELSLSEVGSFDVFIRLITAEGILDLLEILMECVESVLELEMEEEFDELEFKELETKEELEEIGPIDITTPQIYLEKKY